MGDPLTKLLLTISQEYCFQASGIPLGSCVGDDVLALSSESKLLLHLQALRSLDFKISEADTFISDRFMFYCEAGALVPQGPDDLLAVQLKVRSPNLSFFDIPKLKLVLDIATNARGITSDTLGRTALMGKSTKQVFSNHPTMYEWFYTASLIMKLLQVNDVTTIAPFFPIELGGDGLFTGDPAFLQEILEKKRLRGTFTPEFNTLV